MATSSSQIEQVSQEIESVFQDINKQLTGIKKECSFKDEIEKINQTINKLQKSMSIISIKDIDNELSDHSDSFNLDNLKLPTLSKHKSIGKFSISSIDDDDDKQIDIDDRSSLNHTFNQIDDTTDTVKYIYMCISYRV